MNLTLDEAAIRLGKSKRQVRYLIDTGKLPAKKAAGRWFIDSKDLPLSEAQQAAAKRKQRQLRAAVDSSTKVGWALPTTSEENGQSGDGGRCPPYLTQPET